MRPSRADRKAEKATEIASCLLSRDISSSDSITTPEKVLWLAQQALSDVTRAGAKLGNEEVTTVLQDHIADLFHLCGLLDIDLNELVTVGEMWARDEVHEAEAYAREEGLDCKLETYLKKLGAKKT